MTTDPIDLDHLRQWIGRTTEASDIVTAQLVRGLRATLFLDIGAPMHGDAAPFTVHWCLAQPVFPMSELGPDGHPSRGGFLPPVPLPRRMWAGGELEFLDTLRVGDEVTRRSEISDVTMKTGSTGALCFVSVAHVISTARGVAIRERQDIVYRDLVHRDLASGAQPAAAAKPPTPPPAAQHRESHMADPVLLFRYSALTFNGHRIHYDRDYVTKVEGYPGLVFHGPMQAALLVECAARLHGGTVPKKFSYRGVQPLFDGSEFSINATATATAPGMELWTANSAAMPTMKANAVW
jgi:3-methylfumaryl-CoA hydratase